MDSTTQPSPDRNGHPASRGVPVVPSERLGRRGSALRGALELLGRRIERLLRVGVVEDDALDHARERGLAQQQLAEKQSLEEHEFLQPLLYNSMVEQQSLEGRQKALEDRVKQLQQV